MKVHFNFLLNGEEEAWKVTSGRVLMLLNKTGYSGNCMTGVNLGYYRDGRCSYIFINHPTVKPSNKTVGIFCWPDSFEVEKGIRFLGRTKNFEGDVQGQYGIFDVGTIIHTREGSSWELTEEGWMHRVGE